MLTISTFAKLCKVHPRTVVKWIESGRIKADYDSGKLIPYDNAYTFLVAHGKETEARCLRILYGV